MSWKCQQRAMTKTLPIVSKETKERRRSEICAEGQQIVVRLPKDKRWGLVICDTGEGMLYVVRVKKKSEALKVGIKKGDYLYKFNEKNIDITHTSLSFVQFVQKFKAGSQQNITLRLMRK